MLQICGSRHIRKLKQRLIALSVQFVEGIIEIILVLKLTDVLASLDQKSKNSLTSVPSQQLLIAEV